jgi:hypothetical protein
VYSFSLAKIQSQSTERKKDKHMNIKNSAALLAIAATVNPLSITSVSEENEQRIKDAFRTMHGIVQHYNGVTGKNASIPAFADCDGEDLRRVAKRAVAVLENNEQARIDAKYAGVKSAMAEIFEIYMQPAREAKSHLEAARATLPEAMRKLLPEFSSTVDVPVSAVLGCFKGAQQESVLKQLHEMGYKTVKNETSGDFTVRVPFDGGASSSEEQAA